MQKLIILICCMFILNVNAEEVTRPLTEEQSTIVKIVVGAKLLDEESARYKLGDFLVKDGKDTGFYCGFVNAKNSFNAYTGYQPFMMAFLINGNTQKLDGLVLSIASDNSSNAAVMQVCKKEGYDLAL